MAIRQNDYFLDSLMKSWKSARGCWFNMYSVDVERVVYNNPATIVFWDDGTKTVVKCQKGDTYSKELGLAMCFAKKMLGNKGNYYNKFKKLLEED